MATDAPSYRVLIGIVTSVAVAFLLTGCETADKARGRSAQTHFEDAGADTQMAKATQQEASQRVPLALIPEPPMVSETQPASAVSQIASADSPSASAGSAREASGNQAGPPVVAKSPTPVRPSVETADLTATSRSSKPSAVAVAQQPRPARVDRATTRTFSQMVLESQQPVLVDFYATWCGPCRMLAPVLEQAVRETPGARIVKVDIDKSPQLARRYRVSAIPTMIVFRNGVPVAQHRGLADKATVMQLLRR